MMGAASSSNNSDEDVLLLKVGLIVGLYILGLLGGMLPLVRVLYSVVLVHTCMHISPALAAS